MTEIKVGDLVRWKSQANGARMLKVGVVVGIISPGCRVFMGVLDFSGVPVGRDRHTRQFSLTSKRQDRISYVVSVKTGKTDRAKRTLYHPRQEVVLARPGDEEGVFGWNQKERKWNG